ncbi:MAG TPA: 1-acyl-sn-glycerol-3-phosphate acyltransferase [Bacteroidales bacterium]|nr:1-acyl-sn-glycerol-3-phosphate acyltransferase [Bacteroidales bacterium]
MSKFLAKLFIKAGRWKYNDFPDVEKAVVLMAPHTSMWDFVLGKMYFAMHGYKPVVLIKKEAFVWPFGYFLKKMGGIPVDRGKRTGLTDMAIESFAKAKGRFYLVITPEGTRKKTKNWKKGFIRIAKAANVPVVMGYLDCSTRNMGILGLLDMFGTDEEIMERLKKHYLGFTGLHKNKFETGYE